MTPSPDESQPAGSGSPRTDLPTVTVIIPVYNGAALLRTCLTAIQAQTYPPDLFDVIVIDNNSTEDIASAMPADERFALLHEGRKGSYAARNTGLRSATGTVIAFTDGDCRPHEDWLANGVATLRQHPRADMVGGAVKLRFQHGRPRTGSEIYEAEYSFRQDWYLREQHFAATANVLTWRSTLDQVGVFDASLQSRGDAQWGQRVASSGGVQRYAAEAVVEHPARASWREIMKKQVRVARGRRDVDLVDDPRYRHFAGNATAHLKLMVTKPATVWTEDPACSTSGKMRFLGVFLSIRVVYVAASLSGMAKLLGARARQR